MAAASYTTDLATLTTAQAITGWTEPGTWTAGGTPTAETDYFINGNTNIAKSFAATGLGGLVFTAGAGVTIPTDGAFLAWTWFGAPNAPETLANGGIRLIVGSATTAFNAWALGGRDTYEYGGWECRAVDPAVTPDYTVGAPTATRLTFGWAVNNANSVQRGNVFGTGVLRYGRCEARLNGGDLANGYATFGGYATQNDLNANRWGLLQRVEGGFKWQGLMTLGFTSAVDFRDQNVSVVVANTTKVSANFNKIEVRQAGSRVDWTAVSISALGTVSRGRFEAVDDATINITGCTFTDLDTFIFKPASTLTSSTWRRCGQITQGGATFTGCLITRSTAAVAMLASAPGVVTNTTFESAGTGHAIQITTAGTYNFTGLTFTGYAGANGSTGNEALYVSATTGTVTINVSGGSVPTYRTAGATVVVNASSSVTLTGLKAGSEVRAYLGTDPATATEIDGIESSGTTFTFNQSSGGQAGYIQIFALGYQPIRLDITYSGSNVSIPIQQVVDRVYLNP